MLSGGQTCAPADKGSTLQHSNMPLWHCVFGTDTQKAVHSMDTARALIMFRACKHTHNRAGQSRDMLSVLMSAANLVNPYVCLNSPYVGLTECMPVLILPEACTKQSMPRQDCSGQRVRTVHGQIAQLDWALRPPFTKTETLYKLSHGANSLSVPDGQVDVVRIKAWSCPCALWHSCVRVQRKCNW